MPPSVMDGTLVNLQSHQEFLSSWCQKLRLRGISLTNRKKEDRIWAWESRNPLYLRDPRNPEPSFLIPGLLEDLVEMEIWP